MGANAPKEVKILQKFNHFNLIGLYGVCEHDRACYLVYEFMENGSLKEWLEDKNKTSHKSQTWTNRIRIGLDVAKGLQYLHNFASPAYVHKDINSSNILLSKALRAKISKFGLARLSDKDQNGNSSIKCPFESKGYLAPEYLETGFVTTKTDVYAFGVVLLELITGRKAVYVNDDDGKEVMLSEVLSVWGDEKHATDKILIGSRPGGPAPWSSHKRIPWGVIVHILPPQDPVPAGLVIVVVNAFIFVEKL
nr:LysM domain receptor-like kinase 4 [Tanacetum cinerariifolium]